MVLNHICANNAEGQRVLRGGSGKQRQGWRSAGVEPWMGSSTDEHRPRSTMRTTLDYSTFNIQHSTSTDAPKSFAGGPPALPALKLQPLTHNSNTTKNCRSIRRKKTADCSHSLPFQKTLN